MTGDQGDRVKDKEKYMKCVFLYAGLLSRYLSVYADNYISVSTTAITFVTSHFHINHNEMLIM